MDSRRPAGTPHPPVTTEGGTRNVGFPISLIPFRCSPLLTTAGGLLGGLFGGHHGSSNNSSSGGYNPSPGYGGGYGQPYPSQQPVYVQQEKPKRSGLGGGAGLALGDYSVFQFVRRSNPYAVSHAQVWAVVCWEVFSWKKLSNTMMSIYTMKAGTKATIKVMTMVLIMVTTTVVVSTTGVVTSFDLQCFSESTCVFACSDFTLYPVCTSTPSSQPPVTSSRIHPWCPSQLTPTTERNGSG